MSTIILDRKLKYRILKDTGLDACIDLDNHNEQWLWRLCMTAAAFRSLYALYDYEVQVDSDCTDSSSDKWTDRTDRTVGSSAENTYDEGGSAFGNTPGKGDTGSPQLLGSSTRHFKSVISDTVSNILQCCSISSEADEDEPVDERSWQRMFSLDHIEKFIDRVYGACGYYCTSGYNRISPSFSSATVAGITIIRGGIRPYKMHFSGLAPLTMSDDTARSIDGEYVMKLLTQQDSAADCHLAGVELVRRMFCMPPTLAEVADHLHEILESAQASPMRNIDNFVFLNTGKNQGWGMLRSLRESPRSAPAAAYLKQDHDIEAYRRYCLCFSENSQNWYVPVPDFLLQLHNMSAFQDIWLPVNALMHNQGRRPAFKVSINKSGCALYSEIPLPAAERSLFYLLAWSSQGYSLQDRYPDGHTRPVKGFMTHAAMVFFYHVMTYAGYTFKLFDRPY